MAAVIIVVCAVVFVFYVVRKTGRTKEKMRHRDRCAFCRARLKKTVDRMGYATTCSRCGRTQPWAATSGGSVPG